MWSWIALFIILLTAEGSLEVTARGLLRIVGGKVTKKQPALIRTNSATVGIRGGIGIVQTDGSKVNATFLYGEEMTVTPNCVDLDTFGDQCSNDFITTITEPGFSVSVESADSEPSEPEPVTEESLEAVQDELEASEEEPAEEESSSDESSSEESSEESSSEESSDESSSEESSDESSDESSSDDSSSEESSSDESSSDESSSEESLQAMNLPLMNLWPAMILAIPPAMNPPLKLLKTLKPKLKPPLKSPMPAILLTLKSMKICLILRASPMFLPMLLPMNWAPPML